MVMTKPPRTNLIVARRVVDDLFLFFFFFPTRESRIILFNEKYFNIKPEKGGDYICLSFSFSFFLEKQSSTAYGKTCGFARRAKRQFAAAFRLQSLTFPINSPSRENLYLTRLVPTQTHIHTRSYTAFIRPRSRRTGSGKRGGEKIYILATRGKFTLHGVVR